MHRCDSSPCSEVDIREAVASLEAQNYPAWEMIIVGIGLDVEMESVDERVRMIEGEFKNRALALNRGIAEASGDYVVLVNNRDACTTFRLSSLETFMLASDRFSDTGMVYSDYCLMNGDAGSRDIHLLDPHRGRVRDNQDYGTVLFFPKKVLDSVGGLDDSYCAADLYDLRLKVSERHRIIHIKGAKNGYAYRVKMSSRSHNVFDYLMASKDSQLEMEAALTSHLKRIGAYLKPDAHYKNVSYSREEEERFSSCIASVVIPVYDRKAFIGTAIESVQAQSASNIEVIIVCNGGAEDPTIEGVRPYMEGGEKYDPAKPRVRLFVEDINNIGFCLNKGIREARGKYYIQLDSDDRLKPDAVEKLIAVFDSDPRIGMVIGSYEVWELDDTSKEIRRMEDIPVVTHDEWTEENGRNNLLRINGAGAPRAAHIKVIQDLGGFGMNDDAYCYNYGEDYDLVLRVSEHYRIGRVWDPIYDVIRHSGGTDHSIDQATIDRNDNAKDAVRAETLRRRIALNSGKG